jgi:hypothetical protein
MLTTPIIGTHTSIIPTAITGPTAIGTDIGAKEVPDEKNFILDYIGGVLGVFGRLCGL